MTYEKIFDKLDRVYENAMKGRKGTIIFDTDYNSFNLMAILSEDDIKIYLRNNFTKTEVVLFSDYILDITDGNFNKILKDCFNVLKATKNLYQEIEY